MSEVTDEIVDISRKIALRKRTPSRPAGTRRKRGLRDPGSREECLARQSPEATVALAVGCVGVAPSSSMRWELLVRIVFQASALARVSAKYPRRAKEFLATAIDSADMALMAADAAQGSADAVARAASAAVRAAAYSATAPTDHAARAATVHGAVDAATSAADAAFELGAEFADDIWNEIRSDALAMQEQDAHGLVDLPLWSRGIPRWASDDWKSIRRRRCSSMRDGKFGLIGTTNVCAVARRARLMSLSSPACRLISGIGMWRRRTNGSRPICRRRRRNQHGPSSFRRRYQTSMRHLPMAGPRRSASWSSPARRTCPTTGTFRARRTTGARSKFCRIGGERLLKALNDGRYNARREYREALEYYLDDLPKTAGAGNILLANDQVRILHAMFLADAVHAP